MSYLIHFACCLSLKVSRCGSFQTRNSVLGVLFTQSGHVVKDPSSTMGSFVFHGKRLRGTHSSSTGGAASTEIEGTQPQPNTQTTIIYGKSRKVVIEQEYYACRNILCWPAQCFQAFESIAKNYKSEDFS